MTKSEFLALHTALLNLKQNGPNDGDMGICWNLHKLKALKAPSYEELDKIFRAWPKVDTKEVEYNECAHPIDDSKWGGQLWENPLRLELLDFMIEYCEKELEK